MPVPNSLKFDISKYLLDKTERIAWPIFGTCIFSVDFTLAGFSNKAIIRKLIS